MIDTANETICKVCGRSITQTGRGPRKREYCSDACKERAYRERKAEPERQEWRQRWAGYSQVTQGVLEAIMREAPLVLDLVTAAIEFERQGANETDVAQAQVAELSKQVRDLQARLVAMQDVNERFRNDTRVRAFAPWLEKRAEYYAASSFGQRFLAGRRVRLLPPSASRSEYERIMRHTLHYSEEDLETFREAWREMLKTQF